MSDELTTPDPQEEVAEETPVEAPAEDDALAKREAQLKAWEEKLNKKSTELGLTQKQIEERLAALETKPAEDEDDFDPQQLAVLKKALKKLGVDPDAVSSTVTSISQQKQEEMASIYSDFFDSNEVEQEAFLGFLDDMGVKPPTTPAQLRKTLEKGLKAYKAISVDVQKLVAEELAKREENGEKVVSVKAKRSGVSDSKQTLDEFLADPTVGFFEKARRLEELDNA